MVLIIIIVVAIILFIAFIHGLNENYDKSQEMIKVQNDAMEKEHVSVSKQVSFSVAHKQKIRFVVDDKNKAVHFFYRENDHHEIPYDSLMGCELDYNGEVVGRAQRAIVGGVIAGTAGAIVGALTAKQEEADIKLKVYQNSISNPVICYNLLNASEDSFIAKDKGTQQEAIEFANEVIAIINVILKNVK